MTQPVDLHITPIYRQNNRDLESLPGLLAIKAPRRSARGRSGELLVIYLSLTGNAPLSPKGYNKLLAHLAKKYFETPGSSTTAMGALATWLNLYLLERNRRGAEKDMRAVGMMTLAVLRGEHLNLAQCGLSHSFIINEEGLTHLFDGDSHDRGLGLGQRANVRYNLLDISPGDIVLIAPEPPPIWTKAIFMSLRGLEPQAAYQRLIDRIGSELKAALIHLKEGSSDFHLLTPPISKPVHTNITEHASKEQSIALSSAAAREKEKQAEEVSPSTPSISSGTAAPPVETYKEKVKPVGEKRTKTQVGAKTSHPESIHSPKINKRRTQKRSVKRSEKTPRQQTPKEPWLVPAILKIGRAIGLTLQRFWHFLSQMFKRMLPEDSIPTISTSTMAIIAVVVPILVVAVGATVYFSRGRENLYQQYYTGAIDAAESAIQLTDPIAIRDIWYTVLDHLDQAEQYQVTEDSRALRDYAVNVLDDLDGVTRLTFQPALATSLPPDTSIHRIVVTEGDSVIYLLNQTEGHVYRGNLTEQGYVLEESFVCEPVPTPLIVGKLVDILPLPLESEDRATIMGMDGNGNLMRCIPGGAAPLAFQMPPPDMHWGTPLAFESTSLGLYVLDPVTNAVWIFWANDDFGERPTLFFDEQVPPMGDVIDITLNREELYLLHQDGHLTTCSFGYPTRCEDPAMMTDLRYDNNQTATIDGAAFQEIQITTPPDSSIFLLEPTTPSIYRFTLRLNYYTQYRPQSTFAEGSATAFYVSPGHQIFLAIGNQVYVAPLP